MKVTLKKSHTHCGVEYAVGAAIEVNAIEAAWLAEQNVVDAPAPSGKSGKAESVESAA